MTRFDYSQTRPSRIKRLLLRRGGQHWLTLHTASGPVLLRLPSATYRAIIAEFEKRTGRTAGK